MRTKKHIRIEIVHSGPDYTDFRIAEQTHRRQEFGDTYNADGSDTFTDPDTGFRLMSANRPEANTNSCYLLGYNRERDRECLRVPNAWFANLIHAVDAYNKHFGSIYGGKCHFTCGAVLCAECRKCIKDAIVFTFDGSVVGEGEPMGEAEQLYELLGIAHITPQIAQPPSYGTATEYVTLRGYSPPDPNVPEFIPDDDVDEYED